MAEPDWTMTRGGERVGVWASPRQRNHKPETIDYRETGPGSVQCGRKRCLMGRIGLPEMVVILAIALLIFGPRKLPDLARGLGQAIRGFKDAVREGEDKTPTTPPTSNEHKT
jgi:TatA/E family protein of Tat protein translocase